MLLFLWLPLVVFCSDALKEDYYLNVDLPEGTHCYTLLNGTHQFGCGSSTTRDSQGVVVHVETEKQLRGIDSCWRDRFAGYDGGYFLFMDMALLGRTAVDKIIKSECIRGIVLYEDKTLTISANDSLSADAACPNSDGDFYKDCVKWNEKGAIKESGLLRMAWKIQIVFLNNESKKADLMKCHNLFNVPTGGSSTVSYPLCSVSVDQTQNAAGNSRICRRRTAPNSKMIDVRLEGSVVYCDEITGHNIFSYFPPPVQKKGEAKEDKKYLLLASRLDSFGVIPNISPGDFSVMTSLIAMLATAQGMGVHSQEFETAAARSKKHVLMAFFAGESFDYVGSSHMMYLVQNERFPDFGNLTSMNLRLPTISPSEIDGILEPQHIGIGEELHILADNQEKDQHLVKMLTNSIGDGVRIRNGSVNVSGGKMPPSTWHSLKKINKNGVGVVLAPFSQGHYDYGRINSILDRNVWNKADRDLVERRIAVAASGLLLAAADYVKVNSTVRSTLKINPAFVTELFDCFIVAEDYNCTLLRKMGTSNIIHHEVKSTYTSVNLNNFLAKYVYDVLAYASGTTAIAKNAISKEQCDQTGRNQQIYTFAWMGDYLTNKSYCYRFAVNVSAARSPAFLIHDYDLTNTTYSTWTESQYSKAFLKMYLLENSTFDWLFIGGGVILALLSFLVVYRCEEKTFIVDEGEQAAALGEPL